MRDVINQMMTLHDLEYRFANPIAFQEWLYEYAVQTCIWEGVDYHKAGGYISHVMKQKMSQIATYYIANCKHPCVIPTPDDGLVSKLVSKEHGGGRPIGLLEDKNEETD